MLQHILRLRVQLRQVFAALRHAARSSTAPGGCNDTSPEHAKHDQQNANDRNGADRHILKVKFQVVSLIHLAVRRPPRAMAGGGTS